jgi:hypothetical protein
MTSDRDANPFILKLRDPRERFLARVLEACFEKQWRSAEDFLQSFSPGALMDALEQESEVRVRLLVEAGIPAKIAARISPAAAREDLEIAVEEHLTTAARIVDLVPIDVRVQRLDGDALWRFALEGEWLHRASQSEETRRSAAERVSVVIEAALAEELITTRDLLNAMSAEELAASLSEEQLRTVFVFALQSAQQATPVDEAELLSLLDMQKLIADLPIEQTWNRVVIERVAVPYGLSALPGAPTPSNVRASKIGPATERVQRLATPLPAMRGATPIPPAPGRPVTVPIPSAPGRPVVSVLEPRTLRQPAPRARAQTLPDEAVEVMVEEEAEDIDSDLEYTQPNFTEPVLGSQQQRPANAARAPQRSSSGEKGPAARGSDGARRRAATDKLRKLGRLPPNHEYLSLAILRSIEKMYEEIKTRRGKAARAQCVRECFDNPQHLRTGMLALLELLDPHLVPLLENGDPDTLIDALLAQERALWQRERAGAAAAPAPTGLETLPGTQKRPPPSRPLGSAVPLTRMKPGPWH